MRQATSIFTDSRAMPARVLGRDPEHVVDGEVSVAFVDDSGEFCIENPSGVGSMSIVEVMPGIMVLRNDFSMERCVSRLSLLDDVLCVDWCCEGRLEQPMPGGAYAYFAAGDVKVDDRSCHTGEFVFPTGRYRGLTVSYEVERAQRSIERAVDGFPVRLEALCRRFCREGEPAFLRGSEDVVRVLSDTMGAAAEGRRAMCQVKAIELLLRLDALGSVRSVGVPYYPRTQIDRVKAARDRMAADLAATVTVEEAARLARMPLTSFKACFKGVYGASPAAYMRRLRMDRAAQLLRETDLRVSDVGAAVGYESPSKFSAAFRSVWGVCPAEYRRQA